MRYNNKTVHYNEMKGTKNESERIMTWLCVSVQSSVQGCQTMTELAMAEQNDEVHINLVRNTITLKADYDTQPVQPSVFRVGGYLGCIISPDWNNRNNINSNFYWLCRMYIPFTEINFQIAYIPFMPATPLSTNCCHLCCILCRQ